MQRRQLLLYGAAGAGVLGLTLFVGWWRRSAQISHALVQALYGRRAASIGFADERAA